MLKYTKIPFAALMFLAGVAAVSAAPRELMQGERGLFVQDSNGAWRHYNRARRDVDPAPFVTEAPLDHAKGSIY